MSLEGCTCSASPHPPCSFCTSLASEEEAYHFSNGGIAGLRAYRESLLVKPAPTNDGSPLAQVGDLSDYLGSYGKILTERITSIAKPLHDPTKDLVECAALLKSPYAAQAHVITAGVRALQVQKAHWVVGEIGCLAGETEVYDPYERRHRRLDEIKQPFHVWAYDGERRVIAAALPPFAKGRRDLFRVSLSTGESFVATGNHLVLTEEGSWVRVSELQTRGFAASLLRSSWAPARQSSEPGAPRSTRTPPGYWGHCLNGRRPCDALPLWASAIAQGFVLQSAGALEPSSIDGWPQSGDRASTPSCTHPCPGGGLHPMLDSQGPRSGGPGDESSHRDAAAPSRPTGRTSRQCEQQSAHTTSQTRRVRSWYPTANYVGCTPFVTSVEFVREDVYYDFTVPFYHNYCLAGVVHHNSGKTLLAQGIAHTHGHGRPYRALVFAPPHLAAKWERELHETIAKVDITQLERYTDAARHDWHAQLKRPHWFIVTNTMAKLGQPWKAVYYKSKRDSSGIRRCRECRWGLMKKNPADGFMIPMEDKDLEQKRRYCDHCGTPLWTWVNQFDRWPIADYLHTKARGCLDYLVLDEVHECKGDDTEIATAMSQLVSASKKVIALTGTLLGGQADHVRSLLFRMNAKTLRHEGFTWEQHTAFSEKYGRIERVVTEKRERGYSLKTGRGISVKTVKRIRPGVMPSLYANHLIGMCSFLRLEDIADHLPPRPIDEVYTVPMDNELHDEYQRIEEALTSAVKVMLAKRNTKLLGTMLHTLLSYPDRPWDFGEIGYWDMPDEASGPRAHMAPVWVSVVTPKNLSQECLRNKEKKLNEILIEQKLENRQSWVYCNYTDRRDTIPRLEHVVHEAGIRTKVLRSKVPTRSREDWIAKEAPGTPCMISHPMLVRTGLDLFDRGGRYNFPTLIWYSTGYDLFTLRQASGRAWRIGQTEPCRTIYLAYEDTMQCRALSIMGQKLVASESIEGKFSTEGLAALIGDDMTMEVALARSLVAKLEEADVRTVWQREASRVIQTVPEPLRRTLRPNKQMRQLALFN